MPDSLVSVIIPTYNRARLVTAALDSVRAQSHRPLEVALVDDGSTDDTAAAVQDWIAAHGGDGLDVSYYYQNNAGAPAARNEGLRRTSGDWVKFLDADDVLHPTGLERQLAQSEALGADQIVFGDLGAMAPDGTDRRPRRMEPPGPDTSTFEYLLTHPVITPTPLHRRPLLERVDGFTEGVKKGQEEDLHLRLALHGVDLIYERGVVAYQRQGQDAPSLSRTRSIQRAPEAHVWIADRKHTLTRRYYEGDPPPRVRTKLARLYWSTGRRAARAGHPEPARICFRAARELDSSTEGRVGSAPYTALTALLPPTYVEQATMALKRAVGFAPRRDESTDSPTAP